jgi:hypothetical protein
MTIKLGGLAEIVMKNHLLSHAIGQVVGWCWKRGKYKVLVIKDMTQVYVWVTPAELEEVRYA